MSSKEHPRPVSTQILKGNKFSQAFEKREYNLLSTGAANVGVLVKAFPELVNGSTRRLGTDIKKDTNW